MGEMLEIVRFGDFSLVDKACPTMLVKAMYQGFGKRTVAR